MAMACTGRAPAVRGTYAIALKLVTRATSGSALPARPLWHDLRDQAFRARRERGRAAHGQVGAQQRPRLVAHRRLQVRA